MEITFNVPKDVAIGEKFQSYFGTYTIKEISAQEGIDAVNTLIAEHEEYQENPDTIKPEQLRKNIIEKATTLNGKPLVIDSLAEFPNRIWQLLVAANEKLNSISDKEARFLLRLSGSTDEPSIQPSP